MVILAVLCKIQTKYNLNDDKLTADGKRLNYLEEPAFKEQSRKHLSVFFFQIYTMVNGVLLCFIDSVYGNE